jgi:hypothetical protein
MSAQEPPQWMHKERTFYRLEPVRPQDSDLYARLLAGSFSGHGSCHGDKGALAQPSPDKSECACRAEFFLVVEEDRYDGGALTLVDADPMPF